MERRVSFDYEKFSRSCRARACYTDLQELGAENRESYIKGVNMVLKHLKRTIEYQEQKKNEK